MPKAALWGAAFLLSWTAGCGRSDEKATAGPGTPDAQRQAAAQIDKLRALPYAGYAPGGADEHDDGVVTCDPQRSCPGYNLYIAHQLSRAELIDAQGNIVRSWEYEPSQFWHNGELLADGDFLVVGTQPSNQLMPTIADDRRYVLRFNWDGDLLWKRRLPAHHDIELTPRDHFLTLTFERRHLPEIDPQHSTRDDRLTLLSQGGRVLEALSLYDLLSPRPDVFPLLPVDMTITGGKPWIDLFHCNSVEWVHHEHLEGKHPIYAPDNVLICFRHQNRVAVVSWDRKEVVWAWGADELASPHDAHVLESGNILVFDNGVGRGWSRVIELDPLRKEIIWEYRVPNPTDFYTVSQGSNQRLPNGNTPITESEKGRAFEVTPDGRIVWEFWCPHKNQAGQRATIVRTTRYERAFVEAIQARYASPASRP